MEEKYLYVIENCLSGEWKMEWNLYLSRMAAEEQIRDRYLDRRFPADHRIVRYAPYVPGPRIPEPAPPCSTKEPRYCFEYNNGLPAQRGLKLVQVLDLLAGGARGCVSVECD